MSAGKKKRKAHQHKRKLFSQIREDLQLSGDLPTVPAESLRPEQVGPATQSSPPQIGLITTALRCGWAVPEEKKPTLVDELTKIVNDPEMPAKVKVAAFSALRMADQQQYERDHPELVKGGTNVNINNTTTTNTTLATTGDVFADIKVLEDGYKRITGEEDDQTNSQTSGDVREDGDEESLDEEESYNTEEESEAD